MADPLLHSSTLSWNTFLSRTSVSSLSRATYSNSNTASQSVSGFNDVFRVVKALKLPRYRYEDIQREEVAGQGETYLVERCTFNHQVLAIKHLKISAGGPDDAALRRRLRAVIHELSIMRHPPLQAHPNVLSVCGYGWNQAATGPLPYVLVEYAPYGSFRQYCQQLGSTLSVASKEMLIGDVASGLTALHSCNIVHGDIKLDNVLVFHSWDRPAKAQAKLADFGHSIIVSNSPQQSAAQSIRYVGTDIYNAPEVREQSNSPIDEPDLLRCDIWAFGLLSWEVFLNGDVYLNTAERDGPLERGDRRLTSTGYCETLMSLAKSSVPFSRHDIRGSVLRSLFQLTLQHDPKKRITNLDKLPVLSSWHSSGPESIRGQLAIHLESSEWSYEMFRPENGREIPWENERQIYLSLEKMCGNTKSSDLEAVVTWQMALCNHVGFGTHRDASAAFSYAQRAKDFDHPLAKSFSTLFSPPADMVVSDIPYASHIASLFQGHAAVTIRSVLGLAAHVSLQHITLDSIDVKFSIPELTAPNPATEDTESIDLDLESMDNESNRAESVTSETFSSGTITSETISFETIGSEVIDSEPLDVVDGNFTILHFLFLFDHSSDFNLQPYEDLLRPFLDQPCKKRLMPHDQWPLVIGGSPLAVAISVKSIKSVRALLDLGANPCAPAYHPDFYPDNDPRLAWTPLHLAVKYHNREMLELLLSFCPDGLPVPEVPYGIAMSFSAPVERLAMHGPHFQEALADTIAKIREMSPLDAPSNLGRTALMQAIDFHDDAVVESLLQAQPVLASTRFTSPVDPRTFTYPVLFAAQLAARRDASDVTSILSLLNTHWDAFQPSRPPVVDDAGRTALHLSVTGPSTRATEWVLGKMPGMLYAENREGMTALHSCASAVNCELLLLKGAQVNHTDNHGFSALHRAALYGRPEIVHVLLSHYPKAVATNEGILAPLHCAVIKGSVDIIIALLEAGAPINATDRQGDTPVHIAVSQNKGFILKFLLKKGADPTIRNRRGQSALEVAEDSASTYCALVLQLFAENEGGTWHMDLGRHEELLRSSTQELTSGIEYQVGTVENYDIPSHESAFPNPPQQVEEKAEESTNSQPEDETEEQAEELAELRIEDRINPSRETVDFICRVVAPQSAGLALIESVLERCRYEIAQGPGAIREKSSDLVAKLASAIVHHEQTVGRDMTGFGLIYAEVVLVLVNSLLPSSWSREEHSMFGSNLLEDSWDLREEFRRLLIPQRLQAIAKVLDEERLQGRPRGPLHGRTIIVQDPLRMPEDDGMTSTLTEALVNGRPYAFQALIDKLTGAGLVILRGTKGGRFAQNNPIDALEHLDPRYKDPGLEFLDYHFIRECEPDSSKDKGSLPSSEELLSETLSTKTSPLTMGANFGWDEIVALSKAKAYSIVPSTHSGLPRDGILATDGRWSDVPVDRPILVSQDVAGLVDLIDATKEPGEESMSTSLPGAWKDLSLATLMATPLFTKENHSTGFIRVKKHVRAKPAVTTRSTAEYITKSLGVDLIVATISTLLLHVNVKKSDIIGTMPALLGDAPEYIVLAPAGREIKVIKLMKAWEAAVFPKHGDPGPSHLTTTTHGLHRISSLVKHGSSYLASKINSEK